MFVNKNKMKIPENEFLKVDKVLFSNLRFFKTTDEKYLKTKYLKKYI